MTKESFAIAEAYKRVFESTDGRTVLDNLYKTYCKHTTFSVDPYVTAYQEGHREVVLRIGAMLDAANNPEAIEENHARNSSEHGTGNPDNADSNGLHGHYFKD